MGSMYLVQRASVSAVNTPKLWKQRRTASFLASRASTSNGGTRRTRRFWSMRAMEASVISLSASAVAFGPRGERLSNCSFDIGRPAAMTCSTVRMSLVSSASRTERHSDEKSGSE